MSRDQDTLAFTKGWDNHAEVEGTGSGIWWNLKRAEAKH